MLCWSYSNNPKLNLRVATNSLLAEPNNLAVVLCGCPRNKQKSPQKLPAAIQFSQSRLRSHKYANYGSLQMFATKTWCSIRIILRVSNKIQIKNLKFKIKKRRMLRMRRGNVYSIAWCQIRLFSLWLAIFLQHRLIRSEIDFQQRLIILGRLEQ